MPPNAESRIPTPAIKPPRAAPNSFARRAPAPVRDDRLDETQVAERDGSEAFIGIRAGGLSQPDLDADHDVDAICHLVGRLPTLDHLAEVEAACVERRIALTKAARSK